MTRHIGSVWVCSHANRVPCTDEVSAVTRVTAELVEGIDTPGGVDQVRAVYDHVVLYDGVPVGFGPGAAWGDVVKREPSDSWPYGAL